MMLIKLLITLKMQNIIASANLKDKKQDEIRNILGPESQVIFEISLDLCALVFHVKVQLVFARLICVLGWDAAMVKKGGEEGSAVHCRCLESALPLWLSRSSCFHSTSTMALLFMGGSAKFHSGDLCFKGKFCFKIGGNIGTWRPL